LGTLGNALPPSVEWPVDEASGVDSFLALMVVFTHAYRAGVCLVRSHGPQNLRLLLPPPVDRQVKEAFARVWQ
jgi:hypothetical protein